MSFAYFHSINMVTRTTLKSNTPRESVRISSFEIIRQGPQETIIVHIQNEKIGVIGEKLSMLFLWSLSLKQSKIKIFEKRSSWHP